MQRMENLRKKIEVKKEFRAKEFQGFHELKKSTEIRYDGYGKLHCHGHRRHCTCI